MVRKPTFSPKHSKKIMFYLIPDPKYNNNRKLSQKLQFYLNIFVKNMID